MQYCHIIPTNNVTAVFSLLQITKYIVIHLNYSQLTVTENILHAKSICHLTYNITMEIVQ